MDWGTPRASAGGACSESHKRHPEAAMDDRLKSQEVMSREKPSEFRKNKPLSIRSVDVEVAHGVLTALFDARI